MLLAEVHDRVIGAIENAVRVLDLSEAAEQFVGHLDPVQRHVGDTDQVELALALEIGHRAQLLGRRLAGGARLRVQAQVDEVHPLDLQRAQVVLDPFA